MGCVNIAHTVYYTYKNKEYSCHIAMVLKRFVVCLGKATSCIGLLSGKFIVGFLILPTKKKDNKYSLTPQAPQLPAQDNP